MKISIIIPIYNTFKYLTKCLDSCLNQNIPIDVYEIILVNDGSTDDSNSICKDYNEKYSNIKYIYQENSGLSIARNLGLKIAKGEYIWFVDSDDWIRSNCLSKILYLCYSNNLDMLRIGFAKVDANSDIYNKVSEFSDILSIKSGKDLLKSQYVFGPPLYIFKKSYLIDNKIYFYPNIFHEDNEFTPRALYFANKIGITEEVFYYYLDRVGSITLNTNSKNCFDLLIVCKNLIKFSNSIEDDLKSYINNVISTSFNSLLSYAMNLDKRIQKELRSQISLNKEIFLYMRKSNNFKYKVEGLLFTLFPNNVLYLYKIIKR